MTLSHRDSFGKSKNTKTFCVLLFKNFIIGLGECHSVVECLPSLYKALGSMPSTEKKKSK
jgi:hypothetical protein